MKNKVISILVLLLLVSTISYAQKYRKYPFKSGKVEYKLEGNTTGTRVLLWDDYGYKELSIENSESKMFGQTTVTNSNTLVLGDYIYNWSTEDENLYQSTNPIIDIWTEGKYDEDDIEEFGIKTMEQLGFEKIGTETVLGKTCDVYKGLGKVWVWKCLSLKTEVKLLGTKSTITASNIETNINIAASKFEYPKNRKLIVNGNIDEQTQEEIDEAVEIKPDEIKDALKSLFGDN